MADSPQQQDLDSLFSTRARKGLLWYLLIAYSGVITSLFVYYNNSQNTQIEYLRLEIQELKEENKAAHQRAEQARESERKNILELINRFSTK